MIQKYRIGEMAIYTSGFGRKKLCKIDEVQKGNSDGFRYAIKWIQKDGTAKGFLAWIDEKVFDVIDQNINIAETIEKFKKEFETKRIKWLNKYVGKRVIVGNGILDIGKNKKQQGTIILAEGEFCSLGFLIQLDNGERVTRLSCEVDLIEDGKQLNLFDGAWYSDYFLTI